MPQRHRDAYPTEFREQIIELARAGRSPRELAAEFEPSEQTIRNWIAQADRDSGRRRDGTTSDERKELAALRRENKRLKTEREILKKAACPYHLIHPPSNTASKNLSCLSAVAVMQSTDHRTLPDLPSRLRFD